MVAGFLTFSKMSTVLVLALTAVLADSLGAVHEPAGAHDAADGDLGARPVADPLPPLDEPWGRSRTGHWVSQTVGVGETTGRLVVDMLDRQVGRSLFFAPTGTRIVRAGTLAGESFTISSDGKTARQTLTTEVGAGLDHPFVVLRGDDDAPLGAVLDDGRYELNLGSTSLTVGIRISVRGVLSVAEHPVSEVVLAGQGATFEAAAVAIPDAMVRWEVSTDSGVTFRDVQGGATSTTLTVDDVRLEMDGWQYRARFTTVDWQTWSDPARLFVASNPPAATGAAAPGEHVEMDLYDPGPIRAGGVTVTAPTGTVITSVRDGALPGGLPLEISDDGRTVTSHHGSLGHSGWTVGVTLRVDDDAVIGSVLDDGTVEIVGHHTDLDGTPLNLLLSQSAIVLTVTGEIEIVEHPQDVTVDVGTTAELATGATGHAVSTQWQVSADRGGAWRDIDGATSSLLTLDETTAETSGWYRAVHTNGAGSATTDHAVLRVRTAPYFVWQPASEQTVFPGAVLVVAGHAADGTETTMTLIAELSLDGESWAPYTPGHFPELSPISNGLLLRPVAEMDGVRLRLVAENHLGRTVSDASLVTVAAAPVIEAHPVGVRALVGRAATFSASTPAVSPHRTQQWQECSEGGEWTDIAGATGPTHSTGPTTLEMDQREYRIVFANRYGSTTSDPATLTVRHLRAATLTATPTVRLVDQLL